MKIKKFRKNLQENLNEDLSMKQVKKIEGAFLETIKDSLELGDSLSFVGFGSFKLKERSARKGRNPQTGEEIQIPAKKVVKFKPGKNLKKYVNQ